MNSPLIGGWPVPEQVELLIMVRTTVASSIITGNTGFFWKCLSPISVNWFVTIMNNNNKSKQATFSWIGSFPILEGISTGHADLTGHAGQAENTGHTGHARLPGYFGHIRHTGLLGILGMLGLFCMLGNGHTGFSGHFWAYYLK